jgi:excinuclease ABC subunit A
VGPGAGRHGGQIVAAGTPEEFVKNGSTTAAFLNGQRNIEVPKERRKGNGKQLVLKNATGHNLKKVTLKLPLGQMVCISGVSGSGKSSLIHETLFPVLNRHFYKSRREPLPFQSVEGLEHLDKVIEVDQSPIGRTPRSNPATYTGVFTEIRALYAELPESKIRGYKPGRFSFNVKGRPLRRLRRGRPEGDRNGVSARRAGALRNVQGQTLQPADAGGRFKGKAISDVLDMTVEQAVEFFEHQPKILRVARMLNDVGLGYITLGQHATTLSGGEAQRVKLAQELSKKDTGKTIYILDEPTTGLHFQDIQHLLDVLNKLVNKGNTVLIIEHNLDVIKVSDYVIDLGPEGGVQGGQIIAEGTPEQVAKVKSSYTAKFLREELKS